MSDDLLRENEEGICTLTLNRPDRRNALSNALVGTLTEAIKDASEDDDVNVIVITGKGDKAFCAGGDLMDQQGGGSFLEKHEDRGGFVDLLLTMKESEKPLVAKVNGHALGGGLGVATHCDLAVGVEDATFGTPEIKVGLFPMMITAVLQRNIGRKKAMELMLTGSRISGEEASEIGILNYAVPREELNEKVNELSSRIAGFSPAILSLGRKAFYETEDMSFEQAVKTLHNELTINTMTEDTAEGVMAFMQDREPEWKGE